MSTRKWEPNLPISFTSVWMISMRRLDRFSRMIASRRTSIWDARLEGFQRGSWLIIVSAGNRFCMATHAFLLILWDGQRTRSASASPCPKKRAAYRSSHTQTATTKSRFSTSLSWTRRERSSQRGIRRASTWSWQHASTETRKRRCRVWMANHRSKAVHHQAHERSCRFRKSSSLSTTCKTKVTLSLSCRTNLIRPRFKCSCSFAPCSRASCRARVRTFTGSDQAFTSFAINSIVPRMKLEMDRKCSRMLCARSTRPRSISRPRV